MFDGISSSKRRTGTTAPQISLLATWPTRKAKEPVATESRKRRVRELLSIIESIRRMLTVALLTIGVFAGANAAEPREEMTFGSNPGNLRMFSYVSESVKPSAPLIVVLHGCKQKAGTFARDAGFLALADSAELVLLMPEQKGLPSYLYDFYVFSWVTAIFGANNQNACFNWFEPEDTKRDSGEALSIRQMIDAMVQRYSVDPKRVYIVGLSAGGAMAVVMLTAYPERFAGGAVVAGVPYGCADTVFKALQCMNPGLDLTPNDWRARVRKTTGHEGPMPVPPISIWHGTSDTRVLPRNQQELVDQWTALHGISETFVRSERGGRVTRKSYPGDAVPRVESVSVEGHGHAFPIDETATCGQPGDFVVSAGVCAAREIAQFWGLIRRN